MSPEEKRQVSEETRTRSKQATGHTGQALQETKSAVTVYVAKHSFYEESVYTTSGYSTDVITWQAATNDSKRLIHLIFYDCKFFKNRVYIKWFPDVYIVLTDDHRKGIPGKQCPWI